MNTPRIPTHWNTAEQDHKQIRALAQELGIPPLLAHLLRLRGIATASQAAAFLAPSLDTLTDPFHLTGMQAAVDRLTLARSRGEHVRVFGDYDVDGISGTALLTRALTRFGIPQCTYAIPSRIADGYGLSPAAVAQAHADGVHLLVTVDNGISAREAAQEAKKRGIDLIVTDHHSLEDDLPEAIAVINPKQDSPESPFAHASGSAVAFKLATALNGAPADHADADLDLVALGTVADIVPLLDENRVLVALGLQSIARQPRPGIAALARAAGVATETLRAENIAFHLGPRINAAGRMADGTTALDLLLTESPHEADRLARQLNQANQERRDVEDRITQDAQDQLDTTFDPTQKTLVLARRGWHPGVIGIVASKLQHAYARPVILIAVNQDGLGTASARSSPDLDILEALKGCAPLLERFGGHRAAAGMTLREDRIHEFAQAFEAQARRLTPPGDPVRTLEIDALLSFSQIDGQLLNTIESLEPLGHSNPAPLFSTCGVQILPNSARHLRGGHLKCTLRHDARVFPAIGFNLAARLDPDRLPRSVDIAYTPKYNTWRGETTIQLELRDIRIP